MVRILIRFPLLGSPSIAVRRFTLTSRIALFICKGWGNVQLFRAIGRVIGLTVLLTFCRWECSRSPVVCVPLVNLVVLPLPCSLLSLATRVLVLRWVPLMTCPVLVWVVVTLPLTCLLRLVSPVLVVLVVWWVWAWLLVALWSRLLSVRWWVLWLAIMLLTCWQLLEMGFPVLLISVLLTFKWWETVKVPE